MFFFLSLILLPGIKFKCQTISFFRISSLAIKFYIEKYIYQLKFLFRDHFTLIFRFYIELNPSSTKLLVILAIC